MEHKGFRITQTIKDIFNPAAQLCLHGGYLAFRVGDPVGTLGLRWWFRVFFWLEELRWRLWLLRRDDRHLLNADGIRRHVAGVVQDFSGQRDKRRSRWFVVRRRGAGVQAAPTPWICFLDVPV